MKINHDVREPWRGHLQKIQAFVRGDAQQILILKGQIAELEFRKAQHVSHAGAIVEQLRIEAELPAAVYTLSDDGCFLTAEVPDGGV